MKIKGKFIKFVFEKVHLVGTENIVLSEILEKIADNSVQIPGNKDIYVYILGEWSRAIQISEEEYSLRTYVDSSELIGHRFPPTEFREILL